MSNDFDSPWPIDEETERTVVRPTPGGRRPAPADEQPPPQQPPPAPTQAPPPAYRAPQAPLPIDKLKGLNPLVSAASPLLSLLVSMRNTRSLADVMGLRTRVERQIQTFERDAAQGGMDSETLYAARYCLCTAVDEAVLNTPWGANSIWRDQSLLSVFHRERWGGEKFFLILEGRMRDPARNLYLLELLYLCLSLGFQGKYHVLTGGQRTLDQIIESLYETIRRQRGDFERDLSPHWEAEPDARPQLSYPIPLWVVAAVAAALLLTTYITFSYFINGSSTPAFQAMAGLGRDAAPPARDITLLVPATEPPAPAGSSPGEPAPLVPEKPADDEGLATALTGFLEPEIAQRLVEVIDGDAAVTVRIVGDGLFASGRETIKPELLPRIQRIAAALSEYNDRIPGDIRVVGHTDNVPLKRSLRFEDNWHLSRARAKSVADILRQNSGITRPITEEGQGDTVPLVPNDTRANRARNRRVELLVEK
jgi:type VI secretion system protein ImpK